jgi:nicotinamide-nucleotide amidase
VSLSCEVLSTGDEVLTGMIVDSNAAFLADQLGSLGFEVKRHTTVGDDRETLVTTFRELGARADVVICTGGLGPTVDDLTTEIAAHVLGCGLKLDADALAFMEELWKLRGRPMPENNRKQALIPELSEVLPNPVGTAPGFTARIDRATFFFMPGVPREMKKMFAEQVAPRLARLRPDPAVFEVRVYRCFGMTESGVDRALSDFGSLFPAVKLGFRAHFPEIQIKLTGKGGDGAAVREGLDEAGAEVKKRIGANVFSDGRPLEEVVGSLLSAAKATLSVAESCTGGLLGKMITDVAGSSAYFERGFITYANEAKRELLGVDDAILREHGAVSEACARAMAEGARLRARTTYALAITGIAGPSGGSAEKPVGTVFVALAGESTVVRSFLWPGGREQVRVIAAMIALDMLRRSLQGLPVEEPPHELGRKR